MERDILIVEAATWRGPAPCLGKVSEDSLVIDLEGLLKLNQLWVDKLMD